MRSIILFCLFTLFTLVGCAPLDQYESMASTTREGAGPAACTAWPSDLSFDIFPQEERTLRIRAAGLQPDDQPILQIEATGDEGDDLIELLPVLTDEGAFQETVTLPAYDYMRWNIRLLHAGGAACQFITYGGDEWLEMGVDTPAARAEETHIRDVEMMAADLGIPVEEALRRLEKEDAISELQARLRANEAATFGGLWIEHEPRYRIVAAFAGDAEEMLAQYVPADHPLAGIVEARAVTYTYEQLQADQQATSRILDQLDFSAASGISVQENRVELYVTNRAAFDAALAVAEGELPPSVAVITVYEPLGDSLPFEVTPIPDVFMPQLKQRDVAFMEALLVGELVVEDGCLRVNSENEQYLVIWQADYYLHDNEGRLEILDETGSVAAWVGETIYLGGGTQGSVNDAELQGPIPEHCDGPYWRMGEFLPEEYIPQETADPPTSEWDEEMWLEYTVPDVNLSFSYPAGLYVHQAPKAVQISTSSQPTWSSIAAPQPTSSGLHFDLLYNLNRQMGGTPKEEIENIRGSFEEELEVIAPAAPWPANPGVFMAAYRLVDEREGMVLLFGAVPNPLPDSPQPTIALISVVKEEELESVKPIFAAILGSARLDGEQPAPTEESVKLPGLL